MPVVHIAYEDLTTNAVAVAHGSTPLDIVGLVGGRDYRLYFPDGTAQDLTTLATSSLTRLAATTLISDTANTDTYTSAPHSPNALADMLIAVVTLCNSGGGPELVEVDFGGVAMTQGINHIPSVDDANPAIAVFYLPSAGIPSGSSVLTVNAFNEGIVSQVARAMMVELIEYSGVDQNIPLNFGSMVDHGIQGTGGLSSSVDLLSADDHHVSAFTRRATGATSLPISSDVDELDAGETGTEASGDVATGIFTSTPGAIGTSTHTATFASNATTHSLSFGVRAA